MEVSSHALVQGRVNGCDFDVAIFTNLSQDILIIIIPMEDIQTSKRAFIYKAWEQYEKEKPKFAVINADDQQVTVRSRYFSLCRNIWDRQASRFYCKQNYNGWKRNDVHTRYT